MSSDVDVGVRIDLKGDLLGQLGQVRGQFGELQSMTKVMSLATLGQSLSTLSQQARGLTESLKRPFIDFEAQMISAKARLDGITDTAYGELRSLTKELGATTRFTATQVGQGMNKLVMAGFNPEQIKASMADVTQFVQANNIDFSVGSDIATDISTAFGYRAGEIGRVLDVLTSAANSANTDISMLGYSMAYAAADAASMNISLEESTAAMMVFANAGIKGSMAGTTFKGMVNSLATPTKAAARELSSLGVDVYHEGKLRPLLQIVQDLDAATKDLSEEERNQAMDSIFGERGRKGMATLLNQGPEVFAQFLQQLQDQADGTVKRMAQTWSQSLTAGLKGIQSRKEALFTSITESGRDQLAGLQQLKIGFLDGLNTVAKENTVLSSRISLATQLLSDIGGVLASSGAVLTTVLSGFTALSMYRGQKAIQGATQQPGGLLGGITASQPLPVWVVNAGGGHGNFGAAGGPMPPASMAPSTKQSRPANARGFWRKGYALKGIAGSLAFGGISMGLEAMAIKRSALDEEAQKRALKETFNRNAWGIFGSTAGAVIGSVIAPGIGTAVGGALGQFVGDLAGGVAEHSKSDEAQYKKFLAQQKREYQQRNAEELNSYKGIPSSSFYDPITGKYGLSPKMRPEYDNSLASIQSLLAKRSDLMPHKQVFDLQEEIREFIGENLAAPELMAEELLRISEQIYDNPDLRQVFTPKIDKYITQSGSFYDVQAPLFDLVRQQLPQAYRDSDNYKQQIQGFNSSMAAALERGKGVLPYAPTRKYLPELMQDYNQWRFAQRQEKEQQAAENLEVSRNIAAEITEVKNATQATLEELKSRPLAFRVGGS